MLEPENVWPIETNNQNHCWSILRLTSWRFQARQCVWICLQQIIRCNKHVGFFFFFLFFQLQTLSTTVCHIVYSTNAEAATDFPHLLWNTHMHMKQLTHTHTHVHTLTHMHWSAAIGRAGVIWEYESGSMTSLLFTGIRSSLVPTPHPVSLITLMPHSPRHA